MILFLKNIKTYFLKSKSYLLRFAVFFGIFFLLNHYYPTITKKLYGSDVNFKEPYLVYFFPALFLIFLAVKRSEFANIKYERQKWDVTLLFLCLTLFVFLFPTLKGYINLSGVRYDIVILSKYYFQIILGNFLLFLTILGLDFFKRYMREILLIIFAVILYMTSQLLISIYWEFFSQFIVLSLSKVIPLFSSDYFVNFKSFNIRIGDFSVYIGPPCAGIFSLLTFTFFFVLSSVFMSKGRRLNWLRFFAALVVGLLATLLLNLIRIMTILMVGAYVSKTLAINLFHEYLGALFLVMVFFIYLYYVIPKLYLRKGLKMW